MEKNCLDCGISIEYPHKRCTPCKKILKRETQKRSRLKFKYHKRPNERFKAYKRGALRRGYIFELTEEQFLSMWGKTCFYCNSIIEGIGVDRKNNSIGYTILNVVSCCTSCNRMKGDMNVEEFIEKCRLIADLSFKRDRD